MASNKVNKPSRRNRIPLSCEPCRSRKLRCNREKPCANCIVRDERASCKYETPKSGLQTKSQHHGSGQRDSMQQRIDRLEDLVKNLISEKQKAPVTPDDVDDAGISAKDSVSDVSKSAEGSGKTVIDAGHSVYKAAEDWYDVLQEINELKQVWSESHDDKPEYSVAPTLSNMVDGSSLLFGQVRRTDKRELLTALPPKDQVDKLVHNFFDREGFPIPMLPILHEHTFMREYTEHWRDPTKTSVIWLGLLFSILGINMLAYQQYGEPPDYEGLSESLAQIYRLRTAQCLIIGDIAKCLPYTIEALRLYATTELNRKDDNSRGLWIMTGVIIRAAMNMGYHRDPSQSPNITPLQAEYRRRVWFSATEMDDMASFIVGFPRMLPGTFADTMEPRNVYEWELSEDMTELPPSRPMTENTPVAYLISKTRLFRILGSITDFNNIPTEGKYEQILDIHNNLTKAYQNLPTDFRMHDHQWEYTVSGKKATGSNMQMELLYHQGMCQLHRKYIARGRNDPQYNPSREQCISSALILLKFQCVMEPFWYKVSRTRKVLALPAMILFLELECRRKTPTTNAVSPPDDELLQALNTSCALWEKAQTLSDDVQKTYKILSGMLSSFQRPLQSISSSHPETPRRVFDLPGVTSPLQLSDVDISDDKDWLSMSNEMNIDWGLWDAFIEDAVFEKEG